MKFVKPLLVVLSLSFAPFAHAADQRLDSASAALVARVIQKCVLSSGRIGTISPKCASSRGNELSLSLRKIETPADESGDFYQGAIETSGGAALGGLTLQIKVIVGAGMDSDENSVTFLDVHSDVVGQYAYTSDEPQNGLAVLKAIEL